MTVLGADGNDAPTVSFNLAGVSDWATQMPFLDIAKSMRPMFGHVQGQWGGFSHGDLASGGYLDEQGWVKEIPSGVKSIGSIWDWKSAYGTESRIGKYVFEYEGEGDISLHNVRILSKEPGRIVFESTEGHKIWYKIRETDPRDSGDYIRDISVFRQEDEALLKAGALFNPEWIDIVADAKEFRFMGWMKTNGSSQVSWEDRPTPDQSTWSNGIPVEIMVRLANEAGVDPWFTMPHLADEDYIRNFAEYVRDNLDPGLTAKVEYSNELWNFAFKQARDMRDGARDEYGDTSQSAWLDYQSMKATKVAQIWEEVFAENANAPELINVLGVQTVNAKAADRLLSGEGWRKYDPDGWVDPSSVFDELAGTTYFGSRAITSSDVRKELLKQIKNPNADAEKWLYDQLTDPDFRLSLPNIELHWARLKDVADEHGVGLVAYEGGQHVHHSWRVRGVTKDERAELTKFMTDFVRSPEMAILYEGLWEAWANVSDGAFMQFNDVAMPSRFGSWGLLSDLDDTNPRAEFILKQMRDADPWWDGAAPNAAYLQGRTEVGTAADDQMTGTDQEDFFAGGRGNDIFEVGLGRDGVNGGAGIDTVVLHGAAADYTIGVNGAGYLVTGYGSQKYMVDVENFAFDRGPTLSVQEFLQAHSDPESEDDTNLTPPPSEPPDSGVSDGEIDHADAVTGSSGNDRMTGTASDDRLDGAAGNDVIRGLDGADELSGGTGADRLRGGKGDDTLDGGSGRDILNGGSGADRFYFEQGSGADKIMDFSAADTLDLGDFLSDTQSVEDASSAAANGSLVISNGSDSIIFDGLTLSDLDWMSIA